MLTGLVSGEGIEESVRSCAESRYSDAHYERRVGAGLMYLQEIGKKQSGTAELFGGKLCTSNRCDLLSLGGLGDALDGQNPLTAKDAKNAKQEPSPRDETASLKPTA